MDELKEQMSGLSCPELVDLMHWILDEIQLREIESAGEMDDFCLVADSGDYCRGMLRNGSYGAADDKRQG